MTLQELTVTIRSLNDDEITKLVNFLSSDYDASNKQVSTMSVMIDAFNTPTSKQVRPLRYRPDAFKTN